MTLVDELLTEHDAEDIDEARIERFIGELIEDDGILWTGTENDFFRPLSVHHW